MNISMKFGVFGISFWNSNLIIREELIKVLETIFTDYFDQFNTCIPLFTCNRVEIYFCSDDVDNYLSLLTRIIEEKMQKIVKPFFYYYFNEECLYHLIKVVSGLDSPVIGETEIQGQVKRAYQQACTQKKLPPLLHLLFQKSLHIGKKLRSKKDFNFAKEAFEQLIFNIIKKEFYKDLLSIKILFIGFSKINRKIFSFFLKKGFLYLNFFSISQQNEKIDIKNFNKHLFISQNELRDIENYDVVIFGTNFKNLSFKNFHIFAHELNKRKLIFDLGVPRNFSLDYEEKQLDVYNMDNLNSLLLLTHSFMDNCSNNTLKQWVLIEANKQWELFKSKIYKCQQLAVAN